MTLTIDQRVGHRIRVRRVDLTMSQEDLAEALGISQGYLSNLERGQRSLDVKLLERIAQALKCSMAALLGEEGKAG
jgi:transcriptional regulator with XRE-family HTH domain